MEETLTAPASTSSRSRQRQSASCHGGPQADTRGLPLVAIVGSPNVGKSVLFNALTGAYVTVSNYPGTTVEVSRGKGRLEGMEVGVVDTPGMYRLLPITEEERVARRILLHERPNVVIHVVDVKNLERMLPMTLQLIEASLPVVLDLNLMDEADRLGVQVDREALAQALGIPVAATALALGRGTQQVKDLVVQQARGGAHACCHAPATPRVVQYQPAVEGALAAIAASLQGTYQLSMRTVALLYLQGDEEVHDLVREGEGERADEIEAIAAEARAGYSQPLSYVIARDQREAAQCILHPVLSLPERRVSGFAERLSAAMMRPLTGVPLLLLAMYALYQFVGVLGAQTLVGFLEEDVFGTYVNPWVDRFLALAIPWPVVRDLFGGQYGVITLGVRYAVAIILPIVGTFFIAFSIIEDSGYLPRLAMLIDRVFKRIGLNGRAVIPMVLGFGCDTMATIVTRTLETRRERLLANFLLALAIPCSAQLGVMLGLLAGRPDLLLYWAAIMVGVFLLVGLLAARLMPGQGPSFYMELPPLRLPTLSNVVVKTYTRMEWYFREIFPLFIIASVVIWLGRLTGLFDVAVNALVPLVRWLGLPDQSAVAFLFGFFRRDYGAAGLYDLRASMTGVQVLVATTTMTLFVPCIAQFSVTLKERGWKAALAMSAFIFPFAFLMGGLLSHLLRALGVAL
jgi:ferrous iron transport protein B